MPHLTLTCKVCKKQYKGKTVDRFRLRWNNYKESDRKFLRGEEIKQMPKGLVARKKFCVGENSKEFQKKWNCNLKETEMKCRDLFLEEYGVFLIKFSTFSRLLF